jgi:hypothetical protein
MSPAGDDDGPMAAVNGSAAIPAFLGALDYARQGIDNGLQAYAATAQAVANELVSGAAPAAASLVGAVAARDQVMAAARVFETGVQLLGTLLDLRA